MGGSSERACRFPLLCKIRQARAFGSLPGRRLLAATRLMSFIVFAQSSPAPGAYTGFLMPQALSGVAVGPGVLWCLWPCCCWQQDFWGHIGLEFGGLMCAYCAKHA